MNDCSKRLRTNYESAHSISCRSLYILVSSANFTIIGKPNSRVEETKTATTTLAFRTLLFLIYYLFAIPCYVVFWKLFFKHLFLLLRKNKNKNVKMLNRPCLNGEFRRILRRFFWVAPRYCSERCQLSMFSARRTTALTKYCTSFMTTCVVQQCTLAPTRVAIDKQSPMDER